MPEFTEQDHDRLAELHAWKGTVTTTLERVELGQKLLPARVARRITRAIGKKGAILIAIGAVVGQMLGGAAIPLVQKLLALWVH